MQAKALVKQIILKYEMAIVFWAISASSKKDCIDRARDMPHFNVEFLSHHRSFYTLVLGVTSALGTDSP